MTILWNWYTKFVQRPLILRRKAGRQGEELAFSCLMIICQNWLVNKYRPLLTKFVQQPLILRRQADRQGEELAFSRFMTISQKCFVNQYRYLLAKFIQRPLILRRRTDIQVKNQLLIYHDNPMKLIRLSISIPSREIRSAAINLALTNRQTSGGITFSMFHGYRSKLTIASFK